MNPDVGGGLENWVRFQTQQSSQIHLFQEMNIATSGVSQCLSNTNTRTPSSSKTSAPLISPAAFCKRECTLCPIFSLLFNVVPQMDKRRSLNRLSSKGTDKNPSTNAATPTVGIFDDTVMNADGVLDLTNSSFTWKAYICNIIIFFEDCLYAFRTPRH